MIFFRFSSPLSPAHTHVAHPGAEEHGACFASLSTLGKWLNSDLWFGQRHTFPASKTS